ncbi:SDH family Clp fold serine proteinase [Candidatus Nitrosocosmicus agrestis]|uniref:SDH family Clp fold serine proteinase n=1 Tax=Candidatus Nitrosocosmicus agrestis TaxID=2563600 RepID=UPI00122E05D6|nr:hypothetical protein [Candidatus Nitrosocosmicus sp. SS]KAA2282169.1 hypothetical protein F1Z66_06990 [Candidatus Nitrosocosmicus sp. SS]KAF0869985.1 hypothetical protein E5N71_01820 [Candidatus Nitrosocosmicus sp. SS]
MENLDINNKNSPIFRNIIDPNDATKRQHLISEIKETLESAVITYTANVGQPGSGIMLQDAILMEDILRTVSDQKKGVLMLTSSGGDPNAAEKLMQMFRKRFPDSFQIIVPFYAKSAATLMCLGSDKICMGYGSELGSIDPQIQLIGGEGFIPARAYLDGLNDIRKKVKEEGDPINLYYGMLQQLKPQYLAICRTAIDESRITAQKWLEEYMLNDNPEQAKLVANWLSDGTTYRSHGKPIDFKEAKEKLKLNVDELDKDSDLWQKIWEVFLRTIYHAQVTNNAKLFESKTNSLGMSVNIASIGTKRK